MDQGGPVAAREDSEVASQETPRSLKIASKGVKTAGDFANLMSGLMSDLIEGRVTAQVGNATCNAGGKLLRVVELQYKYGTQPEKGAGQIPSLVLAVPDGD